MVFQSDNPECRAEFKKDILTSIEDSKRTGIPERIDVGNLAHHFGLRKRDGNALLNELLEEGRGHLHRINDNEWLISPIS